jgi:phosphate:Na+ symporter
MVRTGIERAYGSALKNLLGYATRNRLAAFTTGLGIATVLQSSTATALLTISCVGNGLLQTAPALAVMLGADVGSTLVVQALSFNITWLSPALLLLGVTLFLSTAGRKPRQLGRIIIGLGLMLLSLNLIIGASGPLRDSPTLATVVAALADEPMLAVLLATVLTWLAHSSVAVVLLIMSLSSVGLVPIPIGLALVLGANIGSGLIPLMLTLRQPAETRRIPLGNFLFRLIGALLALLIVEAAVTHFTHLGVQPARQIANFHTLFNLALALLFLPLTKLVAQLTERWLPDTDADPNAPDALLENPSHLNPEVIDKPSLALTCATQEVLRMADRVETMLRYALDTFQDDDKQQVIRLSKIDDEVDHMNSAIKLYLTAVSRNQLSEEESRRCMEITTFTIKLEHIGDIIEKNLLTLARKKIKYKQNFSTQGWKELQTLHNQVLENMRLALNVFLSGDLDSARLLIEAKEEFRDLEYKTNKHHLERLRAGQIASIETSPIHLDMVRDLKQINSHLASVAYPILDSSGELLSSRLKARSGSYRFDAVDDSDEEL